MTTDVVAVPAAAVRTVTVPVTGERSGSGPLTWGQQAIWKSVVALARDGFWPTVRRLVTVSASRRLTVEEATQALAALVSRHETLRTRIVDGDGCPRQVVDATGSLAVRVIPVAPAPPQPSALVPETHTPVWVPAAHAPVIDAIVAERVATPLEPDRDWPLTATLVTVDEHVRYLVLVVHHVALDQHATERLLGELRTVLRGRTITEPVGERPLDLAARERTDAGATERALHYWGRTYTDLASEQLPVMDPTGPAGVLECRFASWTLGPALDQLAARHQVSTAAVAAAAVAVVLGRRAGLACCGLLIVVANRFQPGHDRIVAPMSQLGLLSLDVTAGDPARPETLHTVIPAAWRSALQAYRHARYDQAAMDALLARSGRGTDTDVDPRCCLNDLRTDLPWTARPISRPAPPSRLTWVPKPALNWHFYVEIQDLSDHLVLACQADTRRMPAPALEAFARDVEGYVVGAAAAQAPVRQVHPDQDLTDQHHTDQHLREGLQ